MRGMIPSTLDLDKRFFFRRSVQVPTVVLVFQRVDASATTNRFPTIPLLLTLRCGIGRMVRNVRDQTTGRELDESGCRAGRRRGGGRGRRHERIVVVFVVGVEVLRVFRIRVFRTRWRGWSQIDIIAFGSHQASRKDTLLDGTESFDECKFLLVLETVHAARGVLRYQKRHGGRLGSLVVVGVGFRSISSTSTCLG